MMNRSQDSDQPPRKQLPPPVAFNIKAPKPGVAVRMGEAMKKDIEETMEVNEQKTQELKDKIKNWIKDLEDTLKNII